MTDQTPPDGVPVDRTGEMPALPPPPITDPLWASTIRGPSPDAPPPLDPPDPTSTAVIPVLGGIDVTGEMRATELDPTSVMPATDADRTAGRPAPGLDPTAAMPATGVDPTASMSAVGLDRTAAMPAVVAAPGAQHAVEFQRSQRRHRRRWWRRGFKLLALLIVAGVVYVGVNFFLVRWTASRDQARPVDVIVVLGAAQYNGRPSPQLRARLDHTIELWDEGLAPAVFVTGGNQPGDAYTEAETSKKYLVEHGVPEDAISMEDTGRSTWESLANFAGVASEHGWERVLLVTDPYHSLRSRLIAQELGLTAYTSPTRTSPVQGSTEMSRELKEALGISLGRIIGFERLWKLTG